MCFRQAFRLLTMCAIALDLYGCATERVGPFCDSNDQCPSSGICDMAARRCLPVDAAGGEVGDAPGLEALPPPDAAIEAMMEAPPECTVHTDCMNPRPLCVVGRCVPCTESAMADMGCAAHAATPVCATQGNLAGQCVQCASDVSCTGKTPICALETATCRACGQDSECAAKDPAAPGICMNHDDGRCASAGETVVVQGINLQAALDAASAQNKALVLLKGNVDRATFAGPGRVAIVGISSQNKPSVSGGANLPALSITGGEVYLRNLTFRSSAPGLSVKNATLAIQNCTVTSNDGGIVLDDAAFTIQDTTVSGNLEGRYPTGTGTRFGGVLVLNPRTPKRFRNVQVQNNKEAGIRCVGAPIDLDATVTATGNGAVGQPEINIDSTCRP